MSAAPLRALITRPEPEASHWVQALTARGIAACALPLICIAGAPDPQALARAQEYLGDYDALMVVSGSAARHFFGSNQALALIQQAQAAIKTRVWAPGPGTAAMLQALGVPPGRIDQPAADAGQFDSESLWKTVGPHVRPGNRVLIVRGAEPDSGDTGTGRDWLSEQIRAAGGAVDFVVAYTRTAPPWSPQQRALAQAGATDGSLWVLSSTQALEHLRQALPEQSWAGARALVTHPRIGQAARAAGFGQVLACRPALADVAASIESAA
ncbi:MAG: uroporphyrinogen-III synthase [Burkholderiaceae bacterium]|nr:uroporphyrinogen-III synthase [Burkholderiaceae bacterium]MCO5103140.1 uroporphyrinogen-III synthase [Burkholderiaceae bacterium]